MRQLHHAVHAFVSFTNLHLLLQPGLGTLSVIVLQRQPQSVLHSLGQSSQKVVLGPGSHSDAWHLQVQLQHIEHPSFSLWMLRTWLDELEMLI